VKKKFAKLLENNLGGIMEQFKAFKFNIDIFLQLDFFESNIVMIGANGSGKTTLADNLKKTFNPNNGIVISAQRVLMVSKYSSITSVSETTKKLNEMRKRDKTYKTIRDYRYMQNEFDVIMQNLVADNVAVGLEYSKQMGVRNH
jgi:ABC-type branched-subunit amino acid transport system ATPase component